MIINPLSAIGGLGSLFGTAAPAIEAGASVAAGAFGDMVAKGAANTVDGLRDAESLSMDALQGKAETREVVDAIMSAEQSLQAAIAIRDKIVTSYLEVSRMAI